MLQRYIMSCSDIVSLASNKWRGRSANVVCTEVGYRKTAYDEAYSPQTQYTHVHV